MVEIAVDILSTIISSATFFSLYLILALTLNLEYGFSGQLNFGKVLFYAMGAFTTGAIIGNILPMLASVVQYDLCSAEAMQQRILLGRSAPHLTIPLFFISLAAGAAVAAAFGYLLSTPALRIKEGFYLGIVLMAASEAVRIIARTYEPLVCAYHGLGGIPSPLAWLNNPQMEMVGMPAIIWLTAILVYIYISRLTNSPFGRMLKAIRDDDVASDAYGKFVKKARVKVLVLGSAISGLAGVLYTYYIGFVAADDFITARTFDVWVIMTLGGTANNRGVVLGSLVMTAIDRGTRILSAEISGFGIPIEVNYLRFIIIGLIMLLILLYRPQGILPEKPIKTPAFER
ncbi:MAG: branched-chain amino acid ABC transporter permease [Nitrososphaerales archaeon]